MSNLMNRIMSKIIEETPPEITEVVSEENTDSIDKPIEVQEMTQTVIMKENTKNVPHMGFSMQDLVNEMGIVLETQMHKVALSSIRADSLGIFYQLGLVPNSFQLITDENTGVDFYVLKNSNRMVDLYRKILKAINSSKSEVISFPYFTKTKIELPMNYITEKGDFELKQIEIESLFLSPKEVESINYSYVRAIMFVDKHADDLKSQRLLALKIDRLELDRAPYRE